MNQMSTSSEILQTVSRSFALCIPFLEKNKITEVENMYLLSRVADTIEDSSLSIERKKSLMAEFFNTLRDDRRIPDFVSGLREGIIDGHDKVLCVEENYRLILDVFRSIDEPVRDISLKMLAKMSFGMVKYLDNDIRTFEDLDEYCYYVAGVVGLYLNTIVEMKDNVQLDKEKAISVGRYLQKVNIIKNFHKDQHEGRNFWPAKLFGDLDRKDICREEHRKEAMLILEKMTGNAMAEAEAAVDYAASIPHQLSGYRKFVILPVLMATENLRLIKNNPEIFTDPNGVKIQRDSMPGLLASAEEAASSNEALWRFKREAEGS